MADKLSNSLSDAIATINSKLDNGSWQTITVDSTHNYTIPDNGTMYIYISPSDGNLGYWICTISDYRTVRINFNNGFNESAYIPVCAGDVIKFSSKSANASALVQYRKMR